MKLWNNVSKSEIIDLKKKIASLEDVASSNRPGLDFIEKGSYNGVRFPAWPLSINELYGLADYSDILRVVFNARTSEIFRNGIKWEEKFVSKCMDCGKEYDYETKECECGSSNIKHPDIGQTKKWDKFIECCNYNNQSLIEVSKKIERDISIMDKGFMIVLKEYKYVLGDIVEGMTEIKEVLRGDPKFINMVADSLGRIGYIEDGKPALVCPVHRDHLQNGSFCSICKRKLKRAVAFVRRPEQKDIFYIDGEVIYRTRYAQGLINGIPPILAVWQKVVALMEMDRYMKDYYAGRRAPKGVLLVATRTIESLQKFWNWMREQFQKNPYDIVPLGIEPPENSRGKIAEYINFMNTLEEMQYIEARNEMRRSIGANWGVMPIFQADISTSGGLNNEGMQVTVTTREAVTSQETYNKGFYKELAVMMGVEDYNLVLESPEEVDEMAELQREQQKIVNAQGMRSLGFEVNLNEDGEFEYKKIENQNSNFYTHSGQDDMPSNLNANPPAAPASGQSYPRFQGEPKDVERALKTITKDLSLPSVPFDMITIISNDIFKHIFDGMTKEQSDMAKGMILEGIHKGEGQDEIVVKIMSELGDVVDKKSTERIVRTECAALINKLREISFKQADTENKWLYKWLGPDDNRTTQICNNIKLRTMNGVTLDELKKIINEESIKFGSTPREYVPHVNCRHTMVRYIPESA